MMPQPESSHEEAYKRLSGRADALERSTARPGVSGGHAADQAYQILGLLLGGAVVGGALGFGVDRLTGVTAPWGLIVCLLAGFAGGIFLAKRVADRLMARAAAENAGKPAPAAVVRRDEDDDGED